MKNLLIVSLLLTILVACEKNIDDKINANNESELAGTYTGTFQRTGMDASSVTIFFDQNRFQGSSLRPKYPAICRGSFALEGSTINFVDSCSWTADFDWTFILNGNYSIDFTSDSTLVMWRINGSIKDEYRLVKPIR